MRNRVATFVLTVFAAIGVSACLFAQSSEKPPAAKAQEASASAHDLSGVWNLRMPPAARRYIGNTWSAEEPAMTPWGQAKYKETKPSNGPRSFRLEEMNDPVLKSCLPPGVPRIYLQPFPVQITQTPKETMMLFEYDHIVRHIFTDGRQHPADVTPTYMGHSIGHWDGDTLVVDTAGFNDKTWLDRTGHPHSEELRVVERFRRTGQDAMQVDITMEDAKALAKPWTSQLIFQLRPEWDIMEQVCTDNETFLGFEK
jgi:hypothetical protein